jgi:hypothetical protein
MVATVHSNPRPADAASESEIMQWQRGDLMILKQTGTGTKPTLAHRAKS